MAVAIVGRELPLLWMAFNMPNADCYMFFLMEQSGASLPIVGSGVPGVNQFQDVLEQV